MNKLAFRLGTVLTVSALLTGCDSKPEPFGVRSATLERADDCDHLLELLRADALVKMNDRLDAQRHWYDRAVGFGDAEGSSSSSTGSGGPSEGGDSAGGSQPPDYSETNTQVEGVDEADIVKTNGTFIYALHGQQLSIVSAWPTSSLGLSSTTDIEGSPREMFVTEDRVVVFSHVNHHDLFDSCKSSGEYEYGCYRPMTKVSVFDLDGAKTLLKAEHYLEGHYRSSRRIDEQVRLVVNNYNWGGLPGVRYYVDSLYHDDYTFNFSGYLERLEELRAKNVSVIMQSSLEDFVPVSYQNKGGKLEQNALHCGDFYVPGAGSTDDGMSTIAAFDLGADAASLSQTTVMGYTSTVYSSTDSMVLASNNWQWHRNGRAYESDVPVSISYTHLHRFDVSGKAAKPIYRASASVVGRLNDQFSLDEKDGNLRVVTTDTLVSKDDWDTKNHLFTLGQNLERRGAVMGLAPGERVFSTRFVGNRGYVVTFRQVDPLFVFDLADPDNPTLLSELKIPGFSTYMHPIDGGTHLLTIGRDGTDDGQVTDPALQIFDVRDAKNPQLVHKHVLPSGWSEAAFNHKAFTFFKGMLAIPFGGWDNDYHHYTSEMRLFDIDVQKGITERGSVDHTPFFDPDHENVDYWCYDSAARVRRGVFIGDKLYSVSNGGVVVSNLDGMQEVGSVAFPKNDDAYGCYYY